MIDSDKRDIRTRGENEWDFVISSGKRCFSVINKVEEIRISCECVGGLILEAIPNTSGTSDGTHILGLGSSKSNAKIIAN